MKVKQPSTLDPLVITGVGVISISGFGLDSLLPLIPITRNTQASLSNTPRSIELTKPFVQQQLGKKGLRLLDKPTLLALLTAQAALADSGINLDSVDKNRVAVSVGTAMGVADSRYDFYQAALLQGISAANPATFPFTIGNSIASQIALRFQLKGINSSISAGCVSSLAALDWAATQLYSDRVDTVLITAAEAISDSLFSRLQHIPEIAAASLADGAASLVLEKQSTALNREQKIYGQLGESFCGSFPNENFSASNYIARFCDDQAIVYGNGHFCKQLKDSEDKCAKVLATDTTPIAGNTISASGLMQIIYAMIDKDGEKTTKAHHVVCSCPTGYIGHTSLITNKKILNHNLNQFNHPAGVANTSPE